MTSSNQIDQTQLIFMSHPAPTLHLHILPPAQRRLWDELKSVPAHFVLYGGTALALRLGHRQSIDFDLFTFQDIAQQTLLNEIHFLSGAQIVQQQPNTLSVIVNSDDPVNVSFFGLPKLFSLVAADRSVDNGLHIASLLDLAATKVAVVQVRAEAKDYLDIDALITMGNIDLPTALAAACKLYGPSFNPQITLKALSYFEDGDVAHIPVITKTRLAAAARAVDLDRLPTLQAHMRAKSSQ